MKTLLMIPAAMLAAAMPLAAQARDSMPVVERQRLNGPRIGVLVSNEDAPEVFGVDPGRTLLVFGWHIEQLVQPGSGGPALMVQEQITLAGVEKGTVLPTLTALMGMRTPGGFEFGLGPTIGAFGIGLAGAISQSVRWGDVVIPFSLGMAGGDGSRRFMVTMGYAIRRR